MYKAATHGGLFLTSLSQNGSAHGRIFETFKRRFQQSRPQVAWKTALSAPKKSVSIDRACDSSTLSAACVGSLLGRIGHSWYLHNSSTVRNSAVLISTFPAHLTSFFFPAVVYRGCGNEGPLCWDFRMIQDSLFQTWSRLEHNHVFLVSLLGIPPFRVLPFWFVRLRPPPPFLFQPKVSLCREQ